MPAHVAQPAAFPPAYLRQLRRGIRASPYFAAHTLNRDFVGTKGFSVVFRSEARARVEQAFPYFTRFLARAMRPDCNAFYLNPLLLAAGSRVDPHVDRSLRAYLKEVPTPLAVSVLYVEAPPAEHGGALVLARGKRHLARIQPSANTLLVFDGDLTHSVEPVARGERLSLVCEQYALTEEELERVPAYAVETRARGYG